MICEKLDRERRPWGQVFEVGSREEFVDAAVDVLELDGLFFQGDGLFYLSNMTEVYGPVSFPYRRVAFVGEF